MLRHAPLAFVLSLGMALVVGARADEPKPKAADQPAGDALESKAATEEFGDGKLWYDIRLLGIEGRGWDESQTQHPFDRLPAKAEKVVRPPVWSLSRDSAGMFVRFVTDAPQIAARWTLRKDSLAMPHMPATGVSGVDLYARLDDGRLNWVGNGRPAAKTNQVNLISSLPPGRREYWLYLPLYNGVEAVYLGIPQGSTFFKATAWKPERSKPICFYGTSITQGGCASRPGMSYAAILGRRFDRPAINLGFSGNGRMEQEVADLLAELDPCAYVINCLPNMNGEEVAAKVEPLVRTLRKAHPQTPILLVEDRTFSQAVLQPGLQKHQAHSRASLRKAYDALVAAGVTGLLYVPGEPLLGSDGEDTVDGSHPTDLGFVRMADALEKHLRPLLVAPNAAPQADGR